MEAHDVCVCELGTKNNKPHQNPYNVSYFLMDDQWAKVWMCFLESMFFTPGSVSPKATRLSEYTYNTSFLHLLPYTSILPESNATIPLGHLVIFSEHRCNCMKFYLSSYHNHRGVDRKSNSTSSNVFPSLLPTPLLLTKNLFKLQDVPKGTHAYTLGCCPQS